MPLPLCTLVIILALIHMPESKNPNAHKLDWRGAMFIFLGLVGLAYGLISGPVAGWSALPVITALASGVMAIVFFILIELHQSEPLVPLRIFRSPLVWGANAVTFSLYFALNGVIFFLVLNLQQVQGYSPGKAGLGLLPPIILITFLAGYAGSVWRRYTGRLYLFDLCHLLC